MAAVNRSPLVVYSNGVNGAAVDLHGGLTTADFAVGTLTELALDVTVSAITGGTTPTATIALQRKGADNNYYALKTSTAIPAAGGTFSCSVGAGCSTAEAFGALVRIVVTIAGGPTNVPTTISLIGK